MPHVNIMITREGGTAPRQKAALIRGATKLLLRVLKKSPAGTVVAIDEVDLEDRGSDGTSAEELRRRQENR